MPQWRAGVAACIRNFGHETQPSKKACTLQSADKENTSSQSLSQSQDKSSKSVLTTTLGACKQSKCTIQMPRHYIKTMTMYKTYIHCPLILMDPSWSQCCCLFLVVHSGEDEVDEGEAGDGNKEGSDNDTSGVDSDNLSHHDYSWRHNNHWLSKLHMRLLLTSIRYWSPLGWRVETTKNVSYHCSSEHGWNGLQAFCMHQEIVEALIFPVRSDHVVDPWDCVFNA